MDTDDIAARTAQLAGRITGCRRTLVALGDDTRLHLMLSMMAVVPCERGLRVGQIVEITNLSKPTVCHHLKILKEAGLVQMRREGTRTYYTLDSDPMVLDELIDTLQQTRALLARLHGEHFSPPSP